MTMWRLFRSLWAVLFLSAICGPTDGEASDDIADVVNHSNTTWKAEPSFGRSGGKKKYFLGVLPDPSGLDLDEPFNEVSRSAIPDQFDSRNAWPDCPTISDIRNQAACGSCWAFAASEVISDRICIASKGKVTAAISAEDVLACCKKCGRGCQGGSPGAAFVYYREKGTVTGGGYNSRQGCKPYSLSYCGPKDDCTNGVHKTPTCKKSCIAQYTNTYHQDKYYAKSAYYIASNENMMKTNIMKRGPVVGMFEVFEDFPIYQSGVYQHITGESMGWHAVKIIGWGVENGTPYWLAANSWDTTWGENGFFKILRGSNECGIEHAMAAGDFKL